MNKTKQINDILQDIRFMEMLLREARAELFRLENEENATK